MFLVLWESDRADTIAADYWKHSRGTNYTAGALNL